MPIVLNQLAHELHSLASGLAPFQRQPDEIHSQESQLRLAPFVQGISRVSKGLRKNGLVANDDTIFIDAFLIAPTPVWT